MKRHDCSYLGENAIITKHDLIELDGDNFISFSQDEKDPNTVIATGGYEGHGELNRDEVMAIASALYCMAGKMDYQLPLEREPSLLDQLEELAKDGCLNYTIVQREMLGIIARLKQEETGMGIVSIEDEFIKQHTEYYKLRNILANEYRFAIFHEKAIKGIEFTAPSIDKLSGLVWSERADYLEMLKEKSPEHLKAIEDFIVEHETCISPNNTRFNRVILDYLYAKGFINI